MVRTCNETSGDWVVRLQLLMYQLHVHCTSSLNSEIILEASVTAGAATVATEIGNYCTNGHTCEALGWECLYCSRLLWCLGRQSN